MKSEYRRIGNMDALRKARAENAIARKSAYDRCIVKSQQTLQYLYPKAIIAELKRMTAPLLAFYRFVKCHMH